MTAILPPTKEKFWRRIRHLHNVYSCVIFIGKKKLNSIHRYTDQKVDQVHHQLKKNDKNMQHILRLSLFLRAVNLIFIWKILKYKNRTIWKLKHSPVSWWQARLWQFSAHFCMQLIPKKDSSQAANLNDIER